ncbi:MAG TPA: Yip1 family protein [Anaeromyxobacter sp.]|nr:Yip1 family protein [Anaeromyxobacter sp.]
MSETSPNPTQPSSGPVLPPIDPKALVATAIAVVKNPIEFFKGKKAETGLVNCLVFSVAMSLACGALTFVSTLVYSGFALIASFRVLFETVVGGGLIGPFVGGLIVWAVSLIFGSKAPYEPSVRIAAYSSAVLPAMGVASFIALLGWLAGLVMLAISAYGIYIAVMGARVLNFDAPPTATPTA